MSKILIVLIGLGLGLLMFLVITADAQTVIHQTYPGTTIRDYSKPSLVIQPDGTGHQTYPGTTIQDYAKPGIKVEGYNNARTIRTAPQLYIPPLRIYNPDLSNNC